MALSSSGATYPINTKIIGKDRWSRLRLSEQAFQFDMATMVEDHAAGLDISGFDLVWLELAGGVEDRIEQVPDLDAVTRRRVIS